MGGGERGSPSLSLITLRLAPVTSRTAGIRGPQPALPLLPKSSCHAPVGKAQDRKSLLHTRPNLMGFSQHAGGAWESGPDTPSQMRTLSPRGGMWLPEVVT